MSVSSPFIHRPIATSLLGIAVMLGGMLGYLWLPIASLPQGRRDAAELDRIDAAVRASGEKRVIVHSPWAIERRVLHEQREFWTNRCMADYHGVPAVTVTY